MRACSARHCWRAHPLVVHPHRRCEGDTCTEVCARGSVQVDRWLSHAIAQQSRLVQTLPLCYASLLGTHNSAITLADGYGALDEYFRGGCPRRPWLWLCSFACRLVDGDIGAAPPAPQSLAAAPAAPACSPRGTNGCTLASMGPLLPGFFKYIKWAVKDFRDAPLHTNNQLLSLTDQLNLGVRSLEIDTHWVGGGWSTLVVVVLVVGVEVGVGGHAWVVVVVCWLWGSSWAGKQRWAGWCRATVGR